MSVVRIRKQIESETITQPELKPFIGRTVEIVIKEASTVPAMPTGYIPGTGDWEAFHAAAHQIKDYDYQAQVDQDACDVRDAEERFK